MGWSQMPNVWSRPSLSWADPDMWMCWFSPKFKFIAHIGRRFRWPEPYPAACLLLSYPGGRRRRALSPFSRAPRHTLFFLPCPSVSVGAGDDWRPSYARCPDLHLRHLAGDERHQLPTDHGPARDVPASALHGVYGAAGTESPEYHCHTGGGGCSGGRGDGEGGEEEEEEESV